MSTMRKHLLVLILTVVTLSLPMAASAADPIEVAIQWLHTQQLPDGGFGVSGRPNAPMTADVVYALALAGEDPAGPEWKVNSQSALDALAKLAPKYIGTDAGQAGKVARAVAAAGRNPRSFGGMDIIAVIEAAYDPTTGRYHPTFLFRHTIAVEALQRAKLPVPPEAYAALRKAQLVDGGWFWTFGAPKSDVDTTGRVLQVLGQVAKGSCDTTLTRAANYLARAQGASGAWAVEAPSSSPANSNSTALAVAGLRAIGRNPDGAPYIKDGRSAMQALLSFQESSGAFVYTASPGKEEVRLTATTDALLALLQRPGSNGSCSIPYLPVILILH